jgi:hypothetical protein
MSLPELYLLRTFGDDKQTLGKIHHGPEVVAATVELPWKNNERGVSCIPNGRYVAKPHVSPSQGRCFSLDPVDKSQWFN